MSLCQEQIQDCEIKKRRIVSNAQWNVVMLDVKLKIDEMHILKSVDPTIVNY